MYMNNECTVKPEPPEIRAFERVVEACDRFEAAWRAGRRPVIEDYVSNPADPERAELLLELLELELELRAKGGELPFKGEYHRRFPGQESLIDEVFARAEETVVEPGAQAKWR